MIIFISGKMSGVANYNRDLFNRVAEILTAQGFVVINPAILPAGMQYRDYIQICQSMVAVCDAVYLLPDWENSNGARQEKVLAERLGKEVKEYMLYCSLFDCDDNRCCYFCEKMCEFRCKNKPANCGLTTTCRIKGKMFKVTDY